MFRSKQIGWKGILRLNLFWTMTRLGSDSASEATQPTNPTSEATQPLPAVGRAQSTGTQVANSVNIFEINPAIDFWECIKYCKDCKDCTCCVPIFFLFSCARIFVLIRISESWSPNLKTLWRSDLIAWRHSKLVGGSWVSKMWVIVWDPTKAFISRQKSRNALRGST